LPVAAGNEEALDLHVAQDPSKVAMVGGEQGLEDLPVAVGQVAVDQGARWPEPTGDFAGQVGGDEIATLVARQEQKRVVAQFIADLGLDEILVEVGVGLGIRDPALSPTKADAALADVLNRKDPVESVERAFFQVGIVLHGALNARDNRRLGAAVGAVKQG
jgi:hypothetical protein